jgi:hypothetical protein
VRVTEPEDEDRFKPDDDATELDRAVMLVARNLHDAKWPDEAQGVAGAAAYLRETWRGPVGPGVYDVYEALENIRNSADAIMQTIAQAFPDELALRQD